MVEEIEIKVESQKEETVKEEAGSSSQKLGSFRLFRLIQVVVIILIVIGLVSHIILVYRAASSLEYEDGGVLSVSGTGNLDEYEVEFFVILKNPTSTGIDIEELRYDVYIDGNFVGSGIKKSFTIIPGSSNNTYSITFTIEDMSDAAKAIFLQSEGVLRITGTARVPVKMFGTMRVASATAPFTIEEKVEVTGDIVVPVPPAPVILTLAPTSTTSVRLDWTQSTSTNFTRYEVHMSDTAGFEPSNHTLLENITNISETSLNVGDLELGQYHYFIVRVVDTHNLHSESNQVRFPLISPS